MKSQKLLPLFLIASAACSSRNTSGSNAPVAQDLNQSSSLTEIQAIEGRYSLDTVCLTSNNKHYTIFSYFSGDRYALQISQFKNAGCDGLVADFLQVGTVTTSESSENSRSVELSPENMWINSYQDLPAELKACASTIQRSNIDTRFVDSKDCGISLPKSAAYQTRLGDSNGTYSVSLSLQLPDAVTAGIQFPSDKIPMQNSGVGITLPDANQFKCGDATDLKLEQNECRPIEFAKASEDSYIEFEKGTGLYPRIDFARRVLSKGDSDSEHRILVRYRFPCKMTQIDQENYPNFAAINLNFLTSEKRNKVFLFPSQDDSFREIEVRGKGDLMLTQNLQVLNASALRLKNHKVDSECKLLIEVQELAE